MNALVAPLLAVALASCAAYAICAATSARAAGRFGDSTWVAPDRPVVTDSVAAGPRVAGRDHERRWETVLRTPFRVAFYPLHVLSNGVEGGMGVLGPRYLDPKPPHPPKLGRSLGPAIALGGVKDIGVGPALTWAGMPPGHGRLHLSGTLSPIDHRTAHASATFGAGRPIGFRLGVDYDDRPDTRYFGIGNGTDDDRLAYYRLARTDVQATMRLGASLRRQLRIGGGYSAMRPGRGSHASPLLENVFTPAEAPFAAQSTSDLWYGLAGDFAAVDELRNPSRGVHGRFDVRNAAGASRGDPGYFQWRLEGRGYLPVFAKRRVLALRAVYDGVDPGSDGTPGQPFYRLATSEDAGRFAGYSSGRFRDLQLIHTRLEYRWEIFHGASALALYDAGEVQPRTGLFRLGELHTSYGGGLRMGVSDIAVVRAEMAKSVEGLHAVLTLGGDF